MNSAAPAHPSPYPLPQGEREKNGKSKPVLRAENVHRYFMDGARKLEVLSGVSVSLNPGEVTALVGRSGSGKSTLLHLLGLLDRPDEGEIIVDGTPAGKLSESDRSFLRNRFIGFVFQHYFLLPEFSVLDNILMPAKVACGIGRWVAQKEKYLARATELARTVGLERLTQRPATLSGGERQRVGLARALMLEPKVLLCDEPTGNLDPETARHIMDLIFELSRTQGTAVLVVTHDQGIAQRAGSVLRLDHGALNTEK
ncbi:MAG TPA: ABC transporter ATP-binding protein [Planctomycetota bacterium]|nr:ABC transporter ATP-binding protein [Planctomycetota bacterium]